MAKQVIDLGVVANDGTGTPLRTAGDMINDNFNELYDFISHGLFAYLTAPASTTITTGGTYYPIGGIFANDPASGFSFVATPAIKYDGLEPHYFEVHAHATLQCQNPNKTVICGIKKNGNLVTSSLMSQFLKTAEEPTVIGGVIVLELNTDDEVQLVVTSTSNGDIITFNNLTASIKPFLMV